MFVKFESIRFKNILSYGNKWTELNFHDGLNLIKAQNGSGKSTILDAINFCLFGNPFRSIKIAQLINRYNGKELCVELNFKINADSYKLIRGIKPNIYSLSKNGNEIASLSSKKLNQEEIDKLLGINERLFKNIVGIAVTSNKPFLTMSIADKRSLIESIFNIDVLSEMGREVKKRNAMDKSEQRLQLSELSGVQSGITDNKNYIEKIQRYIEQFDETKANNIASLMGSIAEYKAVIEQQQKNVKNGKAAIEKAKDGEPAPTTEEFAEVTTMIGAYDHEQTNIQKTLDSVGGKAVCPICGEKLDDERAVNHFNELRARLKEIKEVHIPKLQAAQNELAERKRKFDEMTKRVNLISQKVIAEEVKLKTNQQTLTDLEKQVKQLEEKTCDLTAAENEVRLQELTERYDAINKTLDELNHRIAVDTKLIDVLGDEGLRMYFFKKLLPILNHRINFYLKKFELQVSLEFDQYMEAKIMVGRFEQAYMQFSGGEKSRIDMAILLSFFDISKMISNWSCSILFIDEVMDAGVDANGTSQFLSALYNIVTETSKNIGIYLISHKLSDIDVNWNEIIEIEKKSMFSELKVGK